MKIDIGDAERLTIYRLISKLNPIECEEPVWSFDDACITARKVGNRSGVPADATTWTYEIHCPHSPAWIASVRAVWRRGALHQPLPTHTQVIDFDDVDDQVGGSNGVAPLLSDWLRSLPL